MRVPDALHQHGMNHEGYLGTIRVESASRISVTVLVPELGLVRGGLAGRWCAFFTVPFSVVGMNLGLRRRAHGRRRTRRLVVARRRRASGQGAAGDLEQFFAHKLAHSYSLLKSLEIMDDQTELERYMLAVKQ